MKKSIFTLILAAAFSNVIAQTEPAAVLSAPMSKAEVEKMEVIRAMPLPERNMPKLQKMMVFGAKKLRHGWLPAHLLPKISLWSVTQCYLMAGTSNQCIRVNSMESSLKVLALSHTITQKNPISVILGLTIWEPA